MNLMAVLDELRKAVESDTRPRVAIAKEAKIHEKTFSAFMNGHRGLAIESIENLARALGLTLKLVKSKG